MRWSILGTFWAAVAIAGTIAVFAYDLPDVNKLTDLTRRPSVTVLASDGTQLALFGDLYGQPVQLRELPAYLPQAVLATEDRRFYRHFGLDVIGIMRAMAANLRAGHIVQGGSTITQQLAKNLFLSPTRTLRRKIQETLLALWLEQRFTKDQILIIYMNRVYFGAGAYGVDAAARRFFGKSSREVSLYEAAMLAGLLKAPSRYNPARNRDLAAQRAKRVLANMSEAGYLSANQAKAASAQSTHVQAVATGRRGRYFADWVLDHVTSYIGYPDRDLTVVTTLDPRLQQLAEAHLRASIAGEGMSAEAGQAAFVALTPDGAVRAMVGGTDYARSQFNRVTQALRQPGSAFKPFVYLAGLEAGLRPNDKLPDAPVTVGGWQPRNYDGRYRGDVTLVEAFAKSINTVAVRVSERAGRKRVIDVARRLGITANLPTGPSVALGTGELTLLELTQAYAVFANAGHGVWAHGIREIRDRAGSVLYRRSGSGPGRVVEPALVGTMNAMLSAVIDRGTGKSAAVGRPAAGKTGTSQGHRDAWFIGYTADLIAGIWVGNDDGRPMRGVTGGGLPARVWHAFMRDALAGRPSRPLLVSTEADLMGQQRSASVPSGEWNGVGNSNGSPDSDSGPR